MKKILYQVHKWLSLIFVLPLLILSITGLILAIRPTSDQVTGHIASPVSLSQILSKVHHEREEATISRIKFTEHFATLYVEEENLHLVTYNRANGELVSDIDRTTDPFYWAVMIHESLVLGKAGKIIVAISGVGLVLVLLSGFFFWQRKNLFSQLKHLFSKGKWSKIKDLHLMMGMMILLPLLFQASTGFMIEFNSLVFSDKELIPHIAPSGCTIDQQIALLNKIELGKKGQLRLCKPGFPYVQVIEKSQTRQLTPQGEEVLVVKDSEWLKSPFLRKSFFVHWHDGENFSFMELPYNALNGMGLLILCVTGVCLWYFKRQRRLAKNI